MNDGTTIVSHYGVIGEISRNRRFSVISPYWDETLPSYSQFFKKYGLSPVCHIYRHPTVKEKELIIFLKVDDSVALLSTLHKEKELQEILFDLAHISRSAFKVLFYFGALRYHLCSLVKTYIETATDFSGNLTIPGLNLELQDKDSFTRRKLCPTWIFNVPVSEIGAITLSGAYSEAIFYEMMAYLTSARSLLDSLLPILKALPSIGRGENPPKERSYHSFMNKITKCTLPNHLVDFLNKNWTWASKLIDYRDCLLHYEILSPASLPYIIAVHSERRIIALQTWLPDNPESRSIKKYKFDEHIEYLSYAHITYLRLLDFAAYISKCTLDELKNS